MSTSSSYQSKFNDIQLKINQLTSTLTFLKEKEQKMDGILSDINAFIATVKTLQGRIDANKLIIGYIEKAVEDLKADISILQKKCDKHNTQNNAEYLRIKNKIDELVNEIHQVKVQLTENDGQTNQCYLAITKLQQKIEQLHPLPVSTDQTGTFPTVQTTSTTLTTQQTQHELKKVFYKIIVTALVTIGIGLISWIGIKYWDAFLYINIQERQKENQCLAIEPQKPQYRPVTKESNKK